MDTLYFEDFSVGARWTFDPWQVTEADIVAFAREHDPQPMHVDPAAAALLPFGGLIASGWQTTLRCVAPFLGELMSRTAAIASPGLEDIRWLRPVRPGDVITPTAEVTEVALSRSRPDRGRVHFLFGGHDAAGNAVMTTRGPFFVFRRPDVASEQH